MNTPDRVLGVDACTAGWVGIALGGTNPLGYLAASIAELVDFALADGPVDALAIDIPIGLPDSGPRQADQLARKEIGPLWSSVFTTPIRPALEEADYGTANGLNREVTGKGISKQAHALRRKLLEVDRFVRTGAPPTIEAHPEVSFARMQGNPLDTRKATWSGARTRFELLGAKGIHLVGDLGFAGLKVSVDDVLDAGATAWTARRFHAGEAESLPNPPEMFSDGIPAAIWV